MKRPRPKPISTASRGRSRAKASRIDTRVVVAASAVKAVLDMACSETIDLIAIATHGHGGLKRLLLGSVTDKVVRGASTPVLVYRPLCVTDTDPALASERRGR